METLNSDEFYDRLARVFDAMTDWQKRLTLEMPFLQRTLDQHRARTLLDTACGTGWHAITLAKKGYTAAGCDASPQMIERARANSAKAQANVRFEVADFNQLNHFTETFDAVLCLGNSMPHLLSQDALVEAMQQMRGNLRRGGVLILQNLNYDMRMKKKPRFFAVSRNRAFTSGRSTSPSTCRENDSAKIGSIPLEQPAIMESVPVGAIVVTVAFLSRGP